MYWSYKQSFSIWPPAQAYYSRSSCTHYEYVRKHVRHGRSYTTTILYAMFVCVTRRARFSTIVREADEESVAYMKSKILNWFWNIVSSVKRFSWRYENFIVNLHIAEPQVEVETVVLILLPSISIFFCCFWSKERKREKVASSTSSRV